MNESPESDARELFLQHQAKQNFIQPPISDDLEGDLAFFIAADPGAGIIRIKFAKPVVAIGFDPADARNLASVLLEKVRELQGAPAPNPQN